MLEGGAWKSCNSASFDFLFGVMVFKTCLLGVRGNNFLVSTSFEATLDWLAFVLAHEKIVSTKSYGL